MDFIQDKSLDFNWGKLLRVPTAGSGTIAATPMILVDGSKAMNIDFNKVVDLALKYTAVTTDHCKSSSQWYNGDDSARLTDKFEPHHLRRFINNIDPNSDNENLSLVNQYKMQLRIISNLILRTLHNHVTPASFKSFLP